MQEKKAYDLMDDKVIAISISSTVIAAARLIETSNVDTLPILEGEKLVGMLDGPTLLNYMIKHSKNDLEGQTIKMFAKEPIFVVKDEPLNEIVAKVVSHNLTRIPVVDSAKSMKCIGIISATDLIKSVE
ncbi:MAG: CBS domain-containing protein [Candidatus Micrarchaeaceae archaeon]